MGAGFESHRLPFDRFLFCCGRYQRVVFDDPTDIETRDRDPTHLLDQLTAVGGEWRTATTSPPDNHLLRGLSRYVQGDDRQRRGHGRPQWGTAPFRRAVRSDGYQAIRVIIDLVLRYAHLFGSIEAHAVVVIDEIDLHPQWQRTVLSHLVELFPNTQFVVTTHSPDVARAAITRTTGLSIWLYSFEWGAAVSDRLGRGGVAVPVAASGVEEDA